MARTCEEIYISKIENGIRGIKMGTKTPDEIDLKDTFIKLKKLNPFMYEDLHDKHVNVVINYNNKKNNRK
jgi:hypothetical protein